MIPMFSTLLAQNQGANDGAAAGTLVGTLIVLIVELAIIAAFFAGLWKTFEKAGKPGWAAIIPIYNALVLLEIVGRPAWWLILLIIPCINIPIVWFILCLDLAKKFGQGVGFGVGLFFLAPIFLAILGFGDAQYQGPAQS